jgi:hypothetical protein
MRAPYLRRLFLFTSNDKDLHHIRPKPVYLQLSKLFFPFIFWLQFFLQSFWPVKLEKKGGNLFAPLVIGLNKDL